MMQGTSPIVCYWCDRRVRRVTELFVNGHGWTKTCSDCVGVVEPAPMPSLVRHAA